MLHEQFKDINIFHTFDDWLPDSLLKSFVGSHVNQVHRKEATDYAITNTLNRLRSWKADDMKAAEESDYNDDDSKSSFEYYSSEEDDNGPYASMNKYKKISKANKLIDEEECQIILQKIFDNNVLWDIDFQMIVYEDKGKLQPGKRFTSRCYCPCGQIHKKWRIKNQLEDSKKLYKYEDNDKLYGLGQGIAWSGPGWLISSDTIAKCKKNLVLG